MRAFVIWTGLLPLALGLGVAIVLVTNISLDVVLGQPIFSDRSLGSIDAPDVAVLHLCAASFPMLVLALLNSRRRSLWTAAFTLTVLVQGWSVYQLWTDSMNGFAGGANIGLGIIVLFSPVAILMMVGMLAIFTRRRETVLAPLVD